MFDDDVRREIEWVATARGWGAAQLLAVAEVESGSKAFATINGRREPLGRSLLRQAAFGRQTRAGTQGRAGEPNRRAGKIHPRRLRAGNCSNRRRLDCKPADTPSLGEGERAGPCGMGCRREP